MKVVTATSETYGASYVKIYPKNYPKIHCVEVYDNKLVITVKQFVPAKDGTARYVEELFEKKFAFRDLLTMHKALTKIFAKHKKKGGKN